jgi:predicted anti-sigma-YlaC factor YlaD
MSEWRRCAEVQELIPELAMGVAPGDERAMALNHLATCAECRQALEETSATVDELLLLAPQHEPTPGFDARVIEALAVDRPSRSRHVSRYVLAAAAVVLAVSLGAGVTRWMGSEDRALASQYRDTLNAANGDYFRAAPLEGAQGDIAGHVFAYEGSPSWVFITVEDAPSGVHRVRYVTDNGLTHWLGVCTVRHRHGSWGTAIDVPVYALDSIQLVHDGQTISADFGG